MNFSFKKYKKYMKHLDLLKYGIKEVTEVIYNPSYETLYKEKKGSAL